ncbi:TetR/AcrR family transcriptional regulator C-terminal domain-containing protein [Streptomyces sulphureus]|uniref:TetR/AcrR family transcriptional regulator C-terminal domain-containing protein n=1 Tax=Streptomyces sulphureus TaxID=47758 RepID=UPI00037C1D3A|nr:TetR/AcrR family transcriptional regulator C-terminal domain-containing protein [Streptomyces sulphureus]
MLLRKANVVDGALALLDDTGLDGLTMRKLGEALGVRAGALYRHFPSKQALLDAMAERIMASVEVTLEPGHWSEQGVALAGRLRHALLRHRDGARVVAGAYTAEAHTVLFGNTSAALLRQAGLPPRQAAWAVAAVSQYVIGHTIEEQARADLVEGGLWSKKMDAFTELSDDVALSAFDADPEERFVYGLQLFLNGIRHELSTTE